MDFQDRRGAARSRPGKAIMAIGGRRGKADRLNGPASVAGGPCPLEAARPFLTREPRALPPARALRLRWSARHIHRRASQATDHPVRLPSKA